MTAKNERVLLYLFVFYDKSHERVQINHEKSHKSYIGTAYSLKIGLTYIDILPLLQFYLR